MAAQTLPNTGLKAGFIESESGWSAAMNRNLRVMDAMTNLSVKDQDLAVPPSSPAAGDCYIVAASPTGAWANKAMQIALWCSGADLLISEWAFITPKKGLQAYVVDEEKRYQYNGTEWTLVATGGGGGTTPPVESVADPDPSGLGWLNALFLLHMDDIVPGDGSGWYTDSGPGAKYLQMGGPVIPTTTADFKFGSRSARLENSDNSMSFFFSPESDLMIERADTPGSIEMWLKIDDVAVERRLFIKDRNEEGTSTNGWRCMINVGGTITYSHPGVPGATFTTDAAIPVNNWFLFRLVRDGSLIRIQIGGVSKQGTIAPGIDNYASMLMGSDGMYIDEVRWIKGRLLSTEAPAAPWANSGGLP